MVQERTAKIKPTLVSDPAASSRTFPMNKDRIEGAAKEGVGSMKETVGKAVGNTRLEIKGVAEKAAGKIQSAIGVAKDSFKS
jgi:uncharacterized protein YjbJ (UPF0337 family)